MGLKPFLTTLCLCLLTIVPLAGQVVDIPDENFKWILVNENCVDLDGDGVFDGDVDTNNDGEVQVVEAEAALGLGFSNPLGIQSLEGISAFVHLEFLSISFTEITTIEIGSMNQLEILRLTSNIHLETIDLTQSGSLKELRIHDSELSEIDISNCVDLEILALYENNIGTIELNSNIALEELALTDMPLNGVDIDQLGMLERLNLSRSPIVELDLSGNQLLENLTIPETEIESIDLSQNTELESFSCWNTPLTSLDLSNNPLLEGVLCFNNNLNYLNIQNGYTANIIDMQAIGNPGLKCIQVDDPLEAESRNCLIPAATGWCIDEQTSYSLSCSLGLDEIDNIDLVLFPNPAHDVLQIIAPIPWEVEGIYNLSGHRVRLDVSSTESVDVSGLASGLYFVCLEGDGGRVVKRFLKE